MWLFGKKKKAEAIQEVAKPEVKQEAKQEQLEDGELPWGWLYRNKDFIDKISGEYTYFLNNWIDSRTKSPKEQYAALKSFVLYLEDAEKLCKSKGECFEVWFYDQIASKEYLEKRKSELDELIKNFDQIESAYNKKQHEMDELDKKVIEALKQNDGILQSEFVKLFDPIVKDEVAKILYYWSKEGKIERSKSGRSYILRIKEGLK